MTAISGCMMERGESGLDAELARVKAKNGFGVLSQSPHLAEVAAQGQRIRIEPSDGLCIASEAFDVSDRGVFALIADCPAQDARATPDGSSGDEVVELPPSFPGVMTVSITGERGISLTTETDTVDKLDAYLKTGEGRALLGRGGSPDVVEIVETRRLGDALYVLVSDRDANSLGVFANSFWRAFVPVNQRLVLTTISGFSAHPIDQDLMLAFLTQQVTQLRQANNAPVFEDEMRIAGVVDGKLAGGGTIVVARAEEEGTGGSVPQPVARNRAGTKVVKLETLDEIASDFTGMGGPDADHVSDPQSRWAPVHAPIAPARPG
ncbi:hypothetical protein KHP62_13770 [Rhodobacteraceae bacterium NNCM2]|nr:hypothetical protein [Coraliihabitans acroporae]